MDIEKVRNTKAAALHTIASSAYGRYSEIMEDGALLQEAVKATDQISDDQDKSHALNTLALAYEYLGGKMKDTAWLKEAVKTAERIGDDFIELPMMSGRIFKIGFTEWMAPWKQKMQKRSEISHFALFASFRIRKTCIFTAQS